MVFKVARALIKYTLVLVCSAGLTGCAGYSVVSLGVGLATGQTLSDRAISKVTGSDCNVVQTLQGQWYCETRPVYNQSGF